MAMKINGTFMTAILSGALVFGGLSVAAAHHGDVSEHSTTKGKNLAEIERMERQITAELNRKAAMGAQLAMQSPMPAPMTDVMPAPMGDAMPSAMPDEQAAVMGDAMPELAAAEEEDAAN
jgi:hypothetical protein